jgi:hypothetical protein
MLGRVSETERNSASLHGSFYRGRGYDIDASHDNEIKPRIFQKANRKRAYNESHLHTHISAYIYIYSNGFMSVMN